MDQKGHNVRWPSREGDVGILGKEGGEGDATDDIVPGG